MAMLGFILITLVTLVTQSYANTCGGTFTNSSGTFTSPSYPSYYPNNLDCYWYLGSPGDSVHLDFTDLHTEACCDFVIIYSTASGQVLQRYRGDVGGVFVNNDPITVRFHSDYSVSDIGFTCNYIIESEPPVTQSPGCDLLLTNGTGHFNSPNYPSDYPNSVVCRADLVPEPGYMVTIRFIDFLTERGYDIVEVWYGIDLQTQMSGTQGVGLFFENEGNITIIFITDSSLTERGFRANYRFTAMPATSAAPLPPPDCGGYLPGPSGNFSSPYYPDNYPNNLYCNWTIGNPGDIVVIDFLTIATEACCDVINVYDMTTDNMIQSFSGVVDGARQLFSIDGVDVLFMTNDAVTNEGFYAEYSISDTLPQTLSPDCGETITSGAGNFSSPGWPSDYPTGINCVWTIEPPSGEYYVYFDDFLLDQSDWLEVYESGSLSSTLTGSEGSDLLIKDKQIVLVMHSGDSGSQRGFLALYQPV